MGVGSEIKIISAQTLLQVNIGNASTATLGILLRDGIVFQAFRCWSDLLLVFCKVVDAEFTHNNTNNNDCGYCCVPHFETNPHHPNMFVFVSGTHTVPDVVQTFVLLQACGAPVMQVCQNCTHTSFFYFKKVLYLISLLYFYFIFLREHATWASASKYPVCFWPTLFKGRQSLTSGKVAG